MGDFYMISIQLGDQTLSQMLIDKNYALPHVGGASPPKIATNAKCANLVKPDLKSITTKVGASKAKLIPVKNGKINPSCEKKRYKCIDLALEVGNTYEVYVINVETINEFYIQLAGI